MHLENQISTSAQSQPDKYHRRICTAWKISTSHVTHQSLYGMTRVITNTCAKTFLQCDTYEHRHLYKNIRTLSHMSKWTPVRIYFVGVTGTET